MITIEGLRKVYSDGKEALRGVDLDLGPGLFGLLGPNGAGKTTLLSILALRLEPTAGSVRYGGLESTRVADHPLIRARVGYLPQSFASTPWLSGREYLWHCARLRSAGVCKATLGERVDALLEGVGLVEAANRPSGTYSGGMRRRLGVAQALINLPELVILDEPTVGLDAEERLRFRELIAEVSENTTVLLSTHIVEDIETTCARLAVIDHGRVVFDGNPGQLLAAADGCLWEIEPGAETPQTAVSLGHRGGGVVREIVWAPDRPAAASEHPATLEDAYLVMLARSQAPAQPPLQGGQR